MISLSSIFTKKPYGALFFGLLLALCILFVKTSSAKAWQVDAEWVDAAHIKVNKITVEDGDKDKLSGEAAGMDLGALNTLINNQSANGKIYPLASGIHGENDLVETKPSLTNHNVKAEFVLGNLCPDGQAEGGRTEGRDPSDRSILDLGGGQLDTGKTGDFVFGVLPFHQEGDGKKKKCDFVTNKRPFDNQYKFQFSINKQERHNIWFRAKDKDTLERVDDSGKSEGEFKRSTTAGENTKFWRVKTEGNCPSNTSYVDVGGGNITGAVISATYETCRRAGAFPVDIAGLEDVKSNPDPNAGGTAAPSCESNYGKIPITWLVCGVLNLLDDTVEASTNVVENLLDFNTEQILGGTGANIDHLKQVWSLFRIIASVSLLGIALIMIIGQAISGE